MSTPLIIDDEVKTHIKALETLAEANPVDMPSLIERLKDPEGKRLHMMQMSRQTIDIPLAYRVTFSIELGHPLGKCRHMSMSVQREGGVPNPTAVWVLAHEFGFWGDMCECDAFWYEDLQGHGKAINIVQRYAKIPTKTG